MAANLTKEKTWWNYYCSLKEKKIYVVKWKQKKIKSNKICVKCAQQWWSTMDSDLGRGLRSAWCAKEKKKKMICSLEAAWPWKGIKTDRRTKQECVSGSWLLIGHSRCVCIVDEWATIYFRLLILCRETLMSLIPL